jgi:8-oxo-dGTP diphosphatase
MRFPSAKWDKRLLEFLPAPARPPFRPYFALMFLWKDDEVLLAHIKDRGWCVPSGRVEPGESGMEAARREAREEAGAEVSDVRYMGCYRITESRTVQWAELYVGRVDEVGEITACAESSECRFFGCCDLPSIYHWWNPLIEKLFAYSKEVLMR